MSRKRRSYETGHRPKLLVVIDDTEECDRAVYFASRRAARIGGNVIMLRVMETHDQSQQWLGVADIMRAEAREEADAQLAKFTARAKAIAGISPECVVREGDTAEEILNLLQTLNREFKKTIVMVTHDPRAASRAHVERHLEKGVLMATVERHDATASHA